MKHIKHTKHYYRLTFILAGAFIAFLVIRAFLYPQSFGEFGFFRGDNLQEQMDKPITFAGKASCNECHSEVAETHKAGRHQGIQCQNCHAPLSVHIEKGDFKELMPIDRSPSLCLRCHRTLPSRPKDFPQIYVKDHTGLNAQELESGFCLKCHPAHEPTPGGAAKEADAPAQEPTAGGNTDG